MPPGGPGRRRYIYSSPVFLMNCRAFLCLSCPPYPSADHRTTLVRLQAVLRLVAFVPAGGMHIVNQLIHQPSIQPSGP